MWQWCGSFLPSIPFSVLKLHLWENPCLSLPARMLSYNLFLTRPPASHEIALLHFLRISPHRLRLRGVNLNRQFANWFRQLLPKAHLWIYQKYTLSVKSLQFLYIKPTKCISVRIYLEKVTYDKLKIMDSVYGKMGVPWYKSPFIDTQKFALMPFKWTLKLCATIRVSVPCFIVI